MRTGHIEIKYQKGAKEVTGFNVDVERNAILYGNLQIFYDKQSGIATPNLFPFQWQWLDMGTSYFGWWAIIGNHTDKVGKDALIVERVDGPYCIICLN